MERRCTLGTKLLQCIISELRKQTSPVLTVNYFSKQWCLHERRHRKFPIPEFSPVKSCMFVCEVKPLWKVTWTVFRRTIMEGPMLDRRCVLGASFFVLCSWRTGFVFVLVVLVDLVVRHANSKQQTANSKQRTANSEQRTTNNEQRTTNNEQQTTNKEQGTRNNGQRVVVAVVVCPRVCVRVVLLCVLCALCVLCVVCLCELLCAVGG